MIWERMNYGVKDGRVCFITHFKLFKILQISDFRVISFFSVKILTIFTLTFKERHFKILLIDT